MFGNVKWFNNEKGYGFIDYAENEDIFVHYSAIKVDGYKTLSEGQRVEFDLIETQPDDSKELVREICRFNMKIASWTHDHSKIH